MIEFRKAPEGQPTSNIELCLQNAEKQLSYWIAAEQEAHTDLRRAVRMVQSHNDAVELHKWQLEQRKSTEVNGL